MIKCFSPARLLGVLAAISCTCATLAFAAQVAPSPEKNQPDLSGRIILDIAAPEKGELPPVVFDHNKHTMGASPGESCANCHDGDFTLRAAKGKTGKDLENAFHETCLSCHSEVQAKGNASPPQKAECRSCHNASALPAGKSAPEKTDGGFDSSLHARHIASDKISVSGSPDNCGACHHPAANLSAPGLKADSCRSCHAASPAGAEDAPPFARVAHATCITCHASLTSSETPLPLTCDSCHSAAKKAEYARMNPVPRLDAGQPDSVRMGGALSPDALEPPPARAPLREDSLEKTDRPQPSMPPVLFNHELHEASAGSCTSCHHNTLRKCSDCHTPSGAAKGGGVSLAAAMHAQDSQRSCVGCHETQKTAKPECAGCHAITPRAKPMQANCESCHTPPERAIPDTAAPKALPPEMPAPDPGSGISPGAFPVPEESGAEPPAGTRERAALAKAPAKISLGALSNEYEPSVFPHRRVVESLIAGLEAASPGMAHFHREPYSLCASCHHNSPPSAAPPSCASCHAKGGGNALGPSSAGGPPPLLAAYHRQCMSCHTAMNIKPAATDCDGCHVRRAAPEKGGR